TLGKSNPISRRRNSEGVAPAFVDRATPSGLRTISSRIFYPGFQNPGLTLANAFSVTRFFHASMNFRLFVQSLTPAERNRFDLRSSTITLRPAGVIVCCLVSLCLLRLPTPYFAAVAVSSSVG